MRETRSSGSVEGVLSDGHLYSDFGLAVPIAFLAAYAATVGAVSFVNIAAFDLIDSKFREAWVSAWLQIYWPLWTVFFSPAAVTALLACWYSRVSGSGAAKLLGAFLLIIIIAMEVTVLMDRHIARYFPWWLLGELATLTAVFFWAAHTCRRATRR